MRRIALIVALGLAAMGWSPASRASEPVSVLLEQAERARSADPAEFRRLLAELNRADAKPTRSQLDQIAYLNAYAQSFGGNLDAGIREAKRLVATAHDADVKFRAGALIVNNFALNGRYNEGLRQLEQTLTLTDQLKDPALREHGFISAAILYNQIGQYQLGRHYADLVMKSPTSRRSLCFAGYYKFDSLLKLHALPPDDAPLLEAISNCSGDGEIVMANLARVTLARKWVAQGKNDKAIALLREHLAEAQSTGYPRVISEVRSLLADLLLVKGDLAGAEENAKATTALGADISTTPPVVSAFLTIYKIADKQGKVADALAAYKRYAEAERGYLEEVKARELAYHLVRQEARQKNQQIELLDRQNRVLQLQQEVDRTSAQNSRLIMLVMALAVALIGYWAYKTKRMHVSLRQMAETDALTGVCNRHHFTVQSEKALAKCALAGEPAALLMFDLAHFKAINDTYGHNTGDWVLKRVADTCKHFCRRIDHLGRIGGEEFAILLHGCDLHVATRLAEDCRVRLAGIDTHESGYKFTVTGSFGVSASSLSGYDLAKLLSHADLMLYRAKREGRNRVRTYAPEMPITLRPQAAPQSEGLAPDEQIASAAEIPSGLPGS
jgi:diguanylate cyclase (GGDEF)-like protein